MIDGNAPRPGLITVHLKGDFAFLLLSIFILMMLYPFLEKIGWGRTVLYICSWFVLFFTTWSIYRHKARFSNVLVALAVLSFLAGIAQFFVVSISFLKFTAIIRIFFYALAILSILNLIFQGTHATIGRLTIAVCGYVLIGMMWAYIYSLIMLFDQGAFRFTSSVTTHTFQPDRNLIDLLHFNYIYYSYITLTTVGYGDITPVSNLAKTFAYMEALIGQLYLAVLIARLIGIKAGGKE